MAKIPGGFNANDHDDVKGFELLPTDWYNVRLDECSLEDTKDKRGKYVKCVFEVMDGKFEKRKIFNNLNIINNNAATVEIAQKHLASLIRACGLPPSTDDTDELIGQEMTIKVRIKKGKGDNADQNAIDEYKPLEGAAKPATASKAASPAKPAAPKKRPKFDDDDE